STPIVGIKTTMAEPRSTGHHSIFDASPGFFDSCRLLQSPFATSIPFHSGTPAVPTVRTPDDVVPESTHSATLQRWSCSSCRAEFESLHDQRSHFKSDFHRLNMSSGKFEEIGKLYAGIFIVVVLETVDGGKQEGDSGLTQLISLIKLSIAGKDTMKEEDFDELTSDSLFKDYDISSISGSEDEDDKESGLSNDVKRWFGESLKKKLILHLQTGERVSLWKCLVLGETENISFQNDDSVVDGGVPCQTEREVIEKLKFAANEKRDNTHLRVVLLAKGGHFAGCVFDGNSVVAHKTFHRYVIRAKAGKKQSSKDASGKTAHSAGSTIRRYNELALKKEIKELLTSWKPYFDSSSCIFIHAPSDNRQLLFDGETPYFSFKHGGVRNVPLTVRRPTLKEARRIYSLLTQVYYEADEAPIAEKDPVFSAGINGDGCLVSSKENVIDSLENKESTKVCPPATKLERLSISSESESEVTGTSTPLHEAAKSGSAQKVLELLEQGLDPCIKDERGRTPYMLATEKEVRNSFRRFMALNLDKWDWIAAKVPSALTKELEESQTAKQLGDEFPLVDIQAEKDAKRKARAKELKKLRKAREKKAQLSKHSFLSHSFLFRLRLLNPRMLHQFQEIAKPLNNLAVVHNCQKRQDQTFCLEELRRAQAAEREKRAAAAERRMAAAATPPVIIPASSNSQLKNAVATDVNCSCCNVSLAGKVPFHRYNYKYCSSSCMHVHREILEEG
ncbi:hypothetical protein RJ639_031746, partial [Escallonia herrerae]